MRSRKEIILIGPRSAGKSTQCSLLAEACKLPSISLDGVATKYFEEHGWCQADLDRILREQGPLAAYHYRWPFFAYAVERVLDEYRDCVFDFGAGHSHYEDDRLFTRVKTAMAPFVNIVLLLPSKDLGQSVELLRRRNLERSSNDDCIVDGYDFMDHWVKDHSNHRLATLTVYTERKTPQQIRDEILERVQD